MKTLHTTFTTALFITIGLNAQDIQTSAWSGQGDNTNWTTSSNWLDYKTPASGGVAVIKDNADFIVDIRTELPGSYDLQPRSGTLNIHAGGRIETAPTTSTETGDFLGPDLTPESMTTINIEGALNNPAILDINHSFAVRYGHTEINIKDHGQFNLHDGGAGGRVFRFYNNIDDDLIAGFVNISGNGIFSNTAKTPMQVDGNSGFFLSDQATFETNGTYKINTTDAPLRHYFFVTGSQVNIHIDELNTSYNNPNSEAIFRFISDDTGISTIHTSTLIFNDGNQNASVEIDASELTERTYQFTLFTYDYATPDGTFDSVTVNKGNYRLSDVNYSKNGRSITVQLTRN